LSKYQKRIVLFCLLMSASLLIGQAAKTVFTYAPLTGWFLGGIFCVAAIISWLKAQENNPR
jgi:hypothetical protein